MRIVILLLVLLTGSVVARADTVLVQYGFDGTLPSAQEGFYIFEHSQGFVEPTNSVKFSGYRSLELQEAPHDETFVELQGIVKPITTGDVLFHFAFFVRNPDQGLNIAVAGPAHFYLQPDGIAFWLRTRDGDLFHNSDSMFRRLFTMQADTWYVVDVVLHVETGTYDLRIMTPQAAEALVLLEQQPNAIKTPGSKLSKISFIGDLEDRDSVHYFVDDVELRVLSSPLRLGPPTKAMFGERWHEELDDLYIGQSYYFSLLLSSRFGDAQTFAVKLIARYAELPAAQRFWRERQADTLVFAGKPGEARPIYEAILRDCPACTSTQRRIEALSDMNR